MNGLTLGLEHSLDTRYRLTKAIDSDLTTLESALDFYAPYNEKKGNWLHNPIPPDPVEAYRACYEFLQEVDPNTRLTTAQYIRKALKKDNSEGSLEILKIVTVLAKYLGSNNYVIEE